MLTRRDFTHGAAVLAGGMLAGMAPCIAAARGLRATIHIDGQSFAYDAEAGRDMGVFRSDVGGFTQACVRVERTDRPLIVHFRPDTDGRRMEAVFELGRLWSGRAENLGPYTAVIHSGGRELAAVDVPQHFWLSRWRWQSAPRPIVGDVGSLIGRHLLPPYGGGPRPAKAHVLEGAPARVASYTVMGLAGVEPKMAGTGERPDIGLVTEHQARYICTGAADALDITRAQAEAASTLPWHMRDEKTGAPVDLDAHAKMSWYANPAVAKPHVAMAATGITVESAHQPALAYVPYLLTGDPYHLEDLQFAANFNRGVLPPDYRLSIPQTRSFAWSMRTLSQAAKVTPQNVPQWLLPRAYWERDLDRTRRWFQKNYVDNPEPLRAVFRVADSPGLNRDEGPTTPEGTWTAPWMDEFLAAALGWMVQMGFDDWRPAFDWKIGSTIARTNGKSGWVRAQATPYRLILRPDKTAPYVSSWAEAWELTSRLWNWRVMNEDDILDKDLTYFTYTRGALVMAQHLGHREAKPCLAWLDDQLRRRGAKIAYKWQLA